MTSRVIRSSVATAVALAAGLAFTAFMSGAAAQNGAPAPSVPTPHAPNGKPDLSGMWGWETRANCGAHCNDLQISREFINIAATLKGGLPYRPGVAELVKRRTAAQDEDPNAHCMPRGAPRIWTDD